MDHRVQSPVSQNLVEICSDILAQYMISKITFFLLFRFATLSAVRFQYKACHYLPAVSWFIELQETKCSRRELEEWQLELESGISAITA